MEPGTGKRATGRPSASQRQRAQTLSAPPRQRDITWSGSALGAQPTGGPARREARSRLVAGQYLVSDGRSLMGTRSARTMPLRHSFNARRYRALTALTGAAFATTLGYQTVTNARPVTNGEASAILYGAWIIGRPGPGAGAFAWTTGATLWPVIAATAMRLDGMSLVRVCASVCALIAFAAIVAAARSLFDDVAALWTSLALALSGALMQQAQTATPRMLAFSGVAVSMWAIARASRRNNRGWLIVAGAAFAVALLAMYGAWFCLIPLVAMLIALRKGRWRADLLVFAWTLLTATLIYITPESQLLLGTLRTVSGAALGPLVTPSAPDRAAIESLAAWYAIPAFVGLCGLALARGQRWVAAALLLGLALGVAYDLVYPTQVSGQTYSLLGEIFGMPLCGLALAHIWTSSDHMRLRRVGRYGARVSVALVVALIVALVGAMGAVAAYDLASGQPPTSGATTYALSHIRPGDRLLVTSLDPVLLALYERGNVRSLNDVYDLTRAHEAEANLCAFDWVLVTNAPAGGSPLQAQVEACGDYAPVYGDAVTARTGEPLGPARTYQLRDAIYVNVFATAHRSGGSG